VYQDNASKIGLREVVERFRSSFGADFSAGA